MVEGFYHGGNQKEGLNQERKMVRYLNGDAYYDEDNEIIKVVCGSLMFKRGDEVKY